MNIVYCKICKTVLAVGSVGLPARHWLDDGTEHNDCGLITVEDDPQREGESVEGYLQRIQETYRNMFE
jgi:hypothetical protein